MQCWKCGTHLENPPHNKLPFRALCDHCQSWLHCCNNCQNYQVGLPNNCKIPGTEYIPDRETVNFCEEFSLLGIFNSKFMNSSDISKKLFGEDDSPTKKDFNSLFD